MKKLTIILLALILSTTVVFSLDNDFKNTLVKIDIVHISDSDYRIDLHTKNPYLSPVKAIKKGDNIYNILLPETNNTITTSASSGDIKSVDVKLYPYAGQDIKNGYTKIVITSSKPLNIKTNIKPEKSTAQNASTENLAKIDKELEKIKKGEIPKRVETPIKKESVAQAEKSDKVALAKISKKDVEKQINKSTPVQKQKKTEQVQPKINKKIEKENKTVSNLKDQKNKVNAPVQKQKEQTPVQKQKKTEQVQPKINKKIEKENKTVSNLKNQKNKVNAPVQKQKEPTPVQKQKEEAVEQNINNPKNIQETTIETRNNLEEISNTKKVEQIENIPKPPRKSAIKYKFILFPVIVMFLIIIGIFKLSKHSKQERYKEVFLNKPNIDITDFTSLINETEKERNKNRNPLQEINASADKQNSENTIINTKVKTQTEIKNKKEFEGVVQNKVGTIKEEMKKEKTEIKPAEINEEKALEEFSKGKEEYKDLSINKLNELRERRRQEKEKENNARLEALKKEQEMVDNARIKKVQEKREQNHKEQIKKHPPMTIPGPSKIKQPEITTNEDGIDIINFQLEELHKIEEEKELKQEKSTYRQKEIIPTYEDKKAESELKDNENTTIGAEQNKIEQETEEAKILNSIKIEADRGFYLAEYMGKHSLVGFMGNQIFVIHTFKEHVKNLNIKYRLVDSSIDKDYYVVKVDNMKFLIKSTKLGLKLELAV